MAKPSDKALRWKERAQTLFWEDLSTLWQGIKESSTPDWDSGKALEYLVIRAFELSKLPVDYPYDVPPGGSPFEQIDGLVYLNDTPFLIECKDRDGVDIEVIAKLRNQLMRRPPATMGAVFVSGTFTDPALLLCDYALPHRITLWSCADIEASLKAEDFACVLRQKYRHLCKFGLTDYSPNYRELEV